MNVQEALTRLKEARAYSGEARHPPCPHVSPFSRHHGNICRSCLDKLDASYKQAVDTLEAAEKRSRDCAALRIEAVRRLDSALADALREKLALKQQLSETGERIRTLDEALQAQLSEAGERIRTLDEALRTRQGQVSEASNAQEELQGKLAAARGAYEALRRQGQVSEDFRRKPNKNWETSYTKKVVDLLRLVGQGFSKFDVDYYHVQKAIDLLTDYHNTMHVAYQQRDEARTTLAAVRCQLEMAQRHIRELANRLAEVRKALDKRVGS